MRQLLLVAAALAGPIGCTGDGGMDMGPPPPRAWPEVVSGGGGTLVPMRLVTLVTQGDPQQPEIESFGDALVASQWWTAVGADYHLDMAGPSMHMTGASLPAGMTSITRPQTIGYLSSTIAAAPPSLQPDGLTVYVLFLPPGVAIAGNESCNDYLLGYHSRYGTGGDAYAVVQHCQFQFASQLEQLTLTASHEVIEAATDPRPGTGWGILSKSPPWAGSAWAAADGATIEEVGDLCEGTRAIEGGFAYQRSWSVSAAKAGGDPCVPALPSPYYNVTSDADWYPSPAGQPATTVEIPLRGWSVGDAPPWGLYAVVRAQSDPTLAITPRVKSSGSIPIGQNALPSMSAGATATLLVDVPANLPSGAWATLLAISTRSGPGVFPAADDDYYRPFAVGVYVP